MKRKKTKGQLIYALSQFERAVRLDEIKGSLRPEDWELVEQDYKKRRKLIKEALGIK